MPGHRGRTGCFANPRTGVDLVVRDVDQAASGRMVDGLVVDDGLEPCRHAFGAHRAPGVLKQSKIVVQPDEQALGCRSKVR